MMYMDDEDQIQQAVALSLASFKNEQGKTRGTSTHNLFEDFFSELKEETYEQEERVPRGFQKELITQVLKDEYNYILFAPTGCGKTFMASKVAQHFLERKENAGGKGTDRIPLVFQQAEAISADIDRKWTISKYCGELGAIENWRLATQTSHVAVLIAQTLLNCLAVNPGALADVDVLIFDECHHTTKEHPFHRIIRDHWKVLPPNKRPKILGLTASPGGNVDYAKTVAKIHTLCENMHSKIIMVTQNTEELGAVLSRPKVELIEVVQEPYLVKLVEDLTKLIKKIEDNAKHKHGMPFTWPEKKTSLEYMRFCEQLARDENQRQPIKSACGLNLMVANCISLLEDLGLESVINYLTALARDTPWPAETATLLRQFKQVYSPTLAHGKRDTLMRKLKALAGDKGFKRGIIFVKTRASAYALHELVSKISAFKPCILVGHAASGGDGMKVKTQKKSVQEFNEGTKNLMIATSVAEEGLDIQSCNTVIRYDAIDTAEALIQSRGRARFQDSSFIVLLKCNSDERTKFYSAQESEANMHRVVKQIQENPGTFYDFLYKDVRGASTPANTANARPKRDIVKLYAAHTKNEPKYNITQTERGFAGDALIRLDKGQALIPIDKVQGATKEEVQLRLNAKIENLLFNYGELEGLVDFETGRISVPTPLTLAIPHAVSTPSPRGIQHSLTSSARALTLAATHKPASTTSTCSVIPAPTTPQMTATHKVSSQQRTISTAEVARAEAAVNSRKKTPVQVLFEFCQQRKYAPPDKSIIEAVPPFTCTITISHVIKHVGPTAPTKKDAEHKAAIQVLILLGEL